MVSVILALTAYRGRKYVWVSLFALIAVTFNPLYPMNMSASLWRIIDAAAALVYAFFLWHYYDPYGKGYRFESYVSSLFPAYEWVIADKTRDFSRKFGRTVESDSNPDFTFRHVRSGKLLAIECKFRSYFYQGGFSLPGRHVANYSRFGQGSGMPVFVVLGVGNSPTKPERMFQIPIGAFATAADGFISERELKTFERDPRRAFSLDGSGSLL
jgi:hypothetical protein